MHYVEDPEGERIMQLVLMTADEPDFLKSWVLYHGSLFGYENLHILDSSTDPQVAQFLSIAHTLGVDVTYSAGDLSVMKESINKKMAAIVKRSDFLIKMDTDEFLALYHPDGPDNKKFEADRVSMQRALHSLPFDGKMYKVTYHSSAKIERNCSHDGSRDMVKQSTVFSTPGKSTIKTFFNSQSYKSIDLGSHWGWVQPGFDGKHFHASPLVILEFSRCYERFLERCRLACISHGYMSANDTKEQAVVKLSKLLQPGKCLVPSCHKVQYYVDHLTNPRDAREAYNEQFSRDGSGGDSKSAGGVGNIEITAVRDVVLSAEQQLHPILEDSP